MGIDEGDLQVIHVDVDVIMGNCPITFVVTYLTKDQHARSNLLVYSPIQCSTIVIIMLCDVIEQCHNALSSVVRKNVMIL